MFRQITLVAIALISVTASARAQVVAGHWTVTFDSDIRAERDTFKVLKRAPATLDLVQHGDSVSGIWRVGALDSAMVRGTFDGRSLKLTSGFGERTIKINGQPATLKVRTDILGAVTGATASGTILIHMGDRPPAPRRWEGERRP